MDANITWLTIAGVLCITIAYSWAYHLGLKDNGGRNVKVVIFTVTCDYEHNTYQIVTTNNAFKHLNCVCKSPSELVTKTFQIGREIRKHKFTATFVYE